MIMTLQNAMLSILPSVDGGRSRLALGLVDELGTSSSSSSSSSPDGRSSSSSSSRSAPSPGADLAGRSTRVTRWRRTSSVIRRVCSSSTIASDGASNRMMWYEPSRWRSIG